MADLFDLAPPPPALTEPSAGARPVKAKGTTFDATTPCPLCCSSVSGIDPMRTCEDCRASGAPARVAWELAKPKNSATSGEQVVHLANAHLIDRAPLPAESSISVGPDPSQLHLGEVA